MPGCVKQDEKVAFCLPTAGRRTQLLHHIVTQPGKCLLVQPCGMEGSIIGLNVQGGPISVHPLIVPFTMESRR